MSRMATMASSLLSVGGGLGTEHRSPERRLGGKDRENSKLVNRVLRDEMRDSDWSSRADPIDAVRCLVIRRRVPGPVKEDSTRRTLEIDRFTER